MKTKYLSKEEREQGTKYFLNWGALNGLGFSFLSDIIISLMAIHFGASNIQLGYISSVMHVSGISLLILPWLLAGKNLVNILFYSWLIRGGVCIFYASLFFFTGKTAVLILLVLYTVFCVVRTFGIAVAPPIQRTLATPSTMGEFVVTLSNRFQVTRFASQFLSFLILSINQLTGISGYLLLMALGILTNHISAMQLKHIPCRERVEYRRKQSIFRIFLQSMRHRERALTLFVKWHALSLMITLAFMIPFLRKIANFSSSIIFLYTLTGTLATIIAGHVLRPFTDRIGSRPVLIMVSFLLAGVAFLWCIVPPTAHRGTFFLLGFLTFFLQSTLFLLIARLELRSIPEENKVGYVSMINFFSAIISLGTGLFGGFLADLGENQIFPLINPFGLTFFIAVILAIQIGILSFFLKDAGSVSIKDTAQILFSTRNLKAFLNVYQFNMTEDLNARKALLLDIGKSDTTVAVDEIRKILRNPLAVEKEEMLKSLFAYPKPVLLDDILREASDEHSYNQATAIFALGAYPHKKVECLLLPLLEHPSATIRSTSAKSLARIGNTTALPTIQQQFLEPSLALWDRMNYLVAISLMDEERSYLEHIFTVAAYHQAPSYEQTIFALTAKTLKMEPALSELYQEENLEYTAGLQLLLEEAKQFQPFFADAQQLVMNYKQQQYQEIWYWCHDMLKAQNTPGQHFPHLHHAISAYDARNATRDTAFAALYFSYQMISTANGKFSLPRQ